jgi:hypothetical protein
MFWMMMYLLVFHGGLATDPSLFPTDDTLRESVKDPSRQELVLVAHENIDAAREKLRDDADQGYLELRALSGNREATVEEWHAVFQRMDRDRSRVDTAILDALFQMRASMTREEWERVFDPPWYRQLLR